jgi:hypothetical protein
MRKLTTFVLTMCDMVMSEDDYIQYPPNHDGSSKFPYPKSYYEKDG